MKRAFPLNMSGEWIDANTRGSEKVSLLTGDGFQSGGQRCFVATRHGAQRLVAHADENHGNEGEDEGGGGADVPLAEDDAEVGGVPGEEHLMQNCELNPW